MGVARVLKDKMRARAVPRRGLFRRGEGGGGGGGGSGGGGDDDARGSRGVHLARLKDMCVHRGVHAVLCEWVEKENERGCMVMRAILVMKEKNGQLLVLILDRSIYELTVGMGDSRNEIELVGQLLLPHLITGTPRQSGSKLPSYSELFISSPSDGFL